MSQIDHTHAPSADHLDDFEAADLLPHKILSRRCRFEVTLICLGEASQQGVDSL